MHYSEKVWNDIFGGRDWGKYPPLNLVRFVARNYYNALSRKDVRFLELGSGPGANLWYLANEGFTVHGIEGSSVAVDKSLSRLKECNLENLIGKVIADDYSRPLPFESNSLDAVIDIESLYCNKLDSSRKIVEEVFRVLKPGGKFFSMTFTEETWGLCGEEVDYHAVYAEEGPMKNAGLSRYTTREDIDILYKLDNNKIVSIEKQVRYLPTDHIIGEWVIEVQKN
ncbi:MAG: class I SAM-dependent methyltransferase [Halobacteriovoraceae bacterium]|nr:class I SAM-dependent methyltransferase [Halobacteriovoraceae bacterium]